jgi:Helix-turn-helix domain
MSIQALAAALKVQGVSPTEKLILLVLANYADEAFRCWPSQAQVGRDSCLSERCIRGALAQLEQKARITRTARYREDKGRLSDLIHLVCLYPANSSGGPEAGARTPPAPDAANPSVENLKTPPTPKGDVEAVWEITPTKSRQRSTSKAQVERSLGAAYKRGHTLEQILGGLKGYFASREATRENGQYIKGVHRMIENDRWLEFSAKAPVHHMAPASPWPRRLHEWVTRSEWDDAGWGPRPGQPGCKAPADEAAQALAERAAAREARLAKQAGASS